MMLPPTSPNRSSMSFGTSTSTCSIESFSFGAYSPSPSKTRRANSSRPPSSHDPSARSYGPYWANPSIRCFPSGASPSGSWAVGNTASTYGCSLIRPYFASSHARSRYSIDGETATRPLCGSPSWSHAGNAGSSESATFSLTEPERVRYRFTSRTTSLGGQSHRRRDAAHAALRPSPRARVTVHLADPVMHQDVGRARRHRPAPRADDRLGRQRALDPFVLEPLVEEVRRAHREQPYGLVEIATAPLTEAPGRGRPFREIAQVHVRRHDEQQILQQSRHTIEV